MQLIPFQQSAQKIAHLSRFQVSATRTHIAIGNRMGGNESAARWREKDMAKNLALALAILLLVVVSTQAQTATGVIQGTVKDDTGAVMVGVRVKLTDQATNQTREQN